MPELSRFFGIVITMYFRDHSPPHFHARYGEHEGKFSIENGTLIAGKLPRRIIALVQEWQGRHIEELRVAWNAIQSREPFDRIEPLE